MTPFAELRLNGQVSIAIELRMGESLAPEAMQDVRAVIEPVVVWPQLWI